jgi:transcriptional regulator with XRE-family HTH domain
MFRERLKALREEKQLTQGQLAKLVDMSQQSIDHYENGRSRPNLDTLKKFSTVFNTTIDYMMGLTDIPGRVDYGFDMPNYLKMLHAFYSNPEISEEAKEDIEKKLESYIRFVLENPGRPYP